MTTPITGHDRPSETAARLHPSAQFGLLKYLSDSALDADYQTVAQRKPHRVPSRGIVAALVTAAFGLLVVVAASQASRGEAAQEASRPELVQELVRGRAALEEDLARIERQRAGLARLRAETLNSTALSQRMRARLQRHGLATGTTAVRGEGLIVRVDDAPEAVDDKQRVLDIDLQRLANGMWAAGAEAISINGQRLGPLTAIRQAGSAITVNYRSLDRPYVMRVIGDRAALPARFAETTSGRAWLDLQRRVNLQLAIRATDNVQVPALTTPTLRFATSQKEEQQQ